MHTCMHNKNTKKSKTTVNAWKDHQLPAAFVSSSRFHSLSAFGSTQKLAVCFSSVTCPVATIQVSRRTRVPICTFRFPTVKAGWPRLPVALVRRSLHSNQNVNDDKWNHDHVHRMGEDPLCDHYD